MSCKMSHLQIITILLPISTTDHSEEMQEFYVKSVLMNEKCPYLQFLSSAEQAIKVQKLI